MKIIFMPCLVKNGSELWQNANGRNESPVSYAQEQEQPKSIGNSITCPKDLEQEEQAQALLYLSRKSGRSYASSWSAGLRYPSLDDKRLLVSDKAISGQTIEIPNIR